MSLVANPDRSSPSDTFPQAEVAMRSDGQPRTRVLLLAAIPAVVVGVLIRAWVIRSPLLPLNADEAITGLQALDVLHGQFRLIVAGNQYGGTTESFLFAPLLTFWSGTWPLRIGASILSVAAAYALYRLARPYLSRSFAVVVGLVGWTMSFAIVIMWSHVYMGYTTGFIAQVVALALACRAMRSTEQLARIAFFAGFAAGFAIWSHPMFGVMSMLALIPPSVLRWRELRTWWVPAAVGGLVGVSPWLVFMLGNGLPFAGAPDSTYVERISNFFVELMPRVFGLRAPSGLWLDPSWFSIAAAFLLVGGALAGLVVLVLKSGVSASPILVCAVLGFPVLALFPGLAFFLDGRYGMPFIGPLLMGLAAWSLLLPKRVSRSAWFVVVVPTVWALALCVPLLQQHVGWTSVNPDAGSEEVLAALRDRDVQYLAGEYWGVYVVDYLADGAIDVKPDVAVRFLDEAARVDTVPPNEVTYLYAHDFPPSLRLPLDSYDKVTIAGTDLYFPKGG